MKKSEMADVMSATFTRLNRLREAGQAEYAHNDDNAFANFERVASDLNLDRKQVLWTYLRKHLDGITSHIKGHISQRESVHGRIDDAHVYLELLRGMIIEDGESVPTKVEDELDESSIYVISLDNCNAYRDNIITREEMFNRIFTVPSKFAKK